jgi:hypothetical protein
LADLIEDSSCPTIKLKFEPSGRKGVDHPYLTAEKNNRCVCCGSEKQLTKHHIFPSIFRKHCPKEQKWRTHHDIVPLCTSCHTQYEVFSDELKKELSIKYNLPILGKGVRVDKSIHSVRSAGRALFKHWDKIPNDRKEKLLIRLQNFFKKEDITKEDALYASKLSVLVYSGDCIPFGKLIVDAVPNLQDFIVIWRKHFIDSMKPKFMPLYWDVNYKL